MKDYVVKHDCNDPRFLVCINLDSFRIFLFYHTVLGAIWGYLVNYLHYKHNRKASFLLEKYAKRTFTETLFEKPKGEEQ